MTQQERNAVEEAANDIKNEYPNSYEERAEAFIEGAEFLSELQKTSEPILLGEPGTCDTCIHSESRTEEHCSGCNSKPSEDHKHKNRPEYFLHRHPVTEERLGLDKDHVIVDLCDYEKALELHEIECGGITLRSLDGSWKPFEKSKSCEPIGRTDEELYKVIVLELERGFRIYSNPIERANDISDVATEIAKLIPSSSSQENNELLKLGMNVYHKDIYHGHEVMKIVGIRENSVELEGDYSGGTHNVCQKDWMPLTGVIFIKAEKQIK